MFGSFSGVGAVMTDQPLTKPFLPFTAIFDCCTFTFIVKNLFVN